MPRTSIPAPIGWPLLPLPDTRGELGFPSLEESVRQSLRILLSTRPGEQLMRPEFGAGLEGFLAEPNTLTTRRRLRDLVRESVERWEDRILLDRVEVWEVPEHPARIRVEIAYRLRRSGAPQKLALTMDVGTTA